MLKKAKSTSMARRLRKSPPVSRWPEWFEPLRASGSIPKNWTDKQREHFKSLKIDALQVGRAWSIKESFWEYHYAGSARKFFDRWYFWATHSRLAPVIEAARTLKRHLPGLLAYCRHPITNAVAGGMNSKIQLIKANARGFRNFGKYRVAILFHCGALSLYPHGTR